jgi:neurotransmitter:Na+ symporter, NSS family
MKEKREHWGSQLGFILAAAGSAIGLGTLWKFPYVTGENGGGLFVLIYACCIFFIGIPVFIAELVLGRKVQRGAVGIFHSLSKDSYFWHIPGWLGVISSFLIMSFYGVVSGWGLNYIFMSLAQFYKGRTPAQIGQIFEILESSGDITFFWQFIFVGMTMGVVWLGIQKGIEYFSKVMTISLLVLLVGLVAYCLTLEGLGEAIRFVFYPDFAAFRPSSVLEALGLSLFTLSLGQGVMLTYGSYMQKDEDIPKVSFIVSMMIVLISLLASLLIFPIIFTFGFAPESGPGLVFKTLPVLFAKLPGAIWISTAFFVLFVFTALTSAIALVEVVVANFIDLLGWPRHKAVMVSGITLLLAGIPSAYAKSPLLFNNWEKLYGSNFFDTINDLVSVWVLPLGALLLCVYTGWIVDKSIIQDEFLKGSHRKKLFSIWYIFIRYLAPAAIFLIMLQSTGIVDVDTWLNIKKDK